MRGLATASGFGGQRGEHTWATRMKKLHELEFIDIKPGKFGPMGNAIIWNPHWILRYHHHIKTPGLIATSYNALIETALDIGATDMTDPWQPFSPRTAIPPSVTSAPGTPVPSPPAAPEKA